MKIALGTVQFGLDYGVANQAGRVSFDEAKKILGLAQEHGIDTLDTAIAYGDSEATLGRLGVRDSKIITKLPAIPDGCANVAAWVEDQVASSLERLGVANLYGVLLHRPDQLLGEHGVELYGALQQLKQREFTQKIGVSIYGPAELQLLSQMTCDLVQAPLNILDRSLVESGWAQRLRQQGTELHVRSTFLQGLLLMNSEQRPEKFSRWAPLWSEWVRWLESSGITALQACLGYVLGVAEVDKMVVGVDSAHHLQQILDASKQRVDGLPAWPDNIDEELINPALWNQL